MLSDRAAIEAYQADNPFNRENAVPIFVESNNDLDPPQIYHMQEVDYMRGWMVWYGTYRVWHNK